MKSSRFLDRCLVLTAVTALCTTTIGDWTIENPTEDEQLINTQDVVGGGTTGTGGMLLTYYAKVISNGVTYNTEMDTAAANSNWYTTVPTPANNWPVADATFEIWYDGASVATQDITFVAP